MLRAATRLRLCSAAYTPIPPVAQAVLKLMAMTIQAANPGRSTPGTYSPDSCYGAVAHKLRQHMDPSWNILLFRPGTDQHKIAHACLYDARGAKVVDTFSGKPVLIDNRVYYDKPGSGPKDYPLNACVSVAEFMAQFL